MLSISFGLTRSSHLVRVGHTHGYVNVDSDNDDGSGGGDDGSYDVG